MINAATLDDAETLKDKRGLIFDLDAAYSEMINNLPRDDRGGVFHPSAVGMCARRNVYEYLRYDAQNNFEEADIEIFDMGHGVHDIVQGKIAKLKDTLATKGIQMEFHPELRRPDIDTLYDDLGVGGTTDGLLKVWKPGVWEQRSILEIKSMKDDFWEQLKAPKEDHLMQAHLYAFRFDCPIIYFWYYNKNTSRRKVYSVIYDSEIFAAAVKRFADQKAYADRLELPPREESWFMCPRCPYNHHCNPSVINKQKGKRDQAAITNIRKSGLFGGRK